MRRLLLLAVLFPAVAPAVELAQVLVAARDAASHRVAQGVADEARAAALAEGLRLLPTVSATGGYTRNQYEVVVEIPGAPGTEAASAVFTPIDQLDLTVRGSLPLVDVGAWMRTGVARQRSVAAREDAEANGLAVAREVTSAWYQHAAGVALVRAATATRDAAKALVDEARARSEAGRATEIDVVLAQASLATAEGQLAEASRSLRAAARVIQRLSGLDVAPSDAPELRSAPGGEGPVEGWLTGLAAVPSVQAASARAAAARLEVGGGVAALLPSLTAEVSERITNASGFGPEAAWAAGVQARWTLGAGDAAAAAGRAAAARTAAARVDLATEEAREAIVAAHDRVGALAVGAEAASLEARAREQVAARARARFDAGTTTLTEVLDAERDLRVAKAAEVQAQGDLAAARADLRLLAHRDVESLR